MLNIEKFKDDIEYIGLGEFGVSGNKIFECTDGSCKECDFRSCSQCPKSRLDWMTQEYKEDKEPIPLLNSREKDIIKSLATLFTTTYEIDKSNLVVVPYDSSNSIEIGKKSSDDFGDYISLVELKKFGDDFKGLDYYTEYTLEELGV